VLVSLLIGVGYDAYVVSGYATKEMCLMDETRETCPMMKPVAEVSCTDLRCYLSISWFCLGLEVIWEGQS